jgi:hypothetical protein
MKIWASAAPTFRNSYPRYRIALIALGRRSVILSSIAAATKLYLNESGIALIIASWTLACFAMTDQPGRGLDEQSSGGREAHPVTSR